MRSPSWLFDDYFFALADVDAFLQATAVLTLAFEIVDLLMG
jgi:hypothetical protein